MLSKLLRQGRKRNTDCEGKRFSKITIAQVWLKAQAVKGQDPNKVRADACGAWLAFAEFGRASPLGWEIDHIKPVALGGDDEIGNLQALHWSNNRHKGNRWPSWSGLMYTLYRAVDRDLVTLRALRSTVREARAGRNHIGDDHGVI